MKTISLGTRRGTKSFVVDLARMEIVEYDGSCNFHARFGGKAKQAGGATIGTIPASPAIKKAIGWRWDCTWDAPKVPKPMPVEGPAFVVGYNYHKKEPPKIILVINPQKTEPDMMLLQTLAQFPENTESTVFQFQVFMPGENGFVNDAKTVSAYVPREIPRDTARTIIGRFHNPLWRLSGDFANTVPRSRFYNELGFYHKPGFGVFKTEHGVAVQVWPEINDLAELPLDILNADQTCHFLSRSAYVKEIIGESYLFVACDKHTRMVPLSGVKQIQFFRTVAAGSLDKILATIRSGSSGNGPVPVNDIVIVPDKD